MLRAVKANVVHLTSTSALQTTDSDGVYKSKEDLFSNLQMLSGEAARALQRTTEPSLSLICDAKSVGSENYYRLNDTKVTTWEHYLLAGRCTLKDSLLYSTSESCNL